jgi:Raf kinase inhibitor-like YbhB/YbcL family protein
MLLRSNVFRNDTAIPRTFTCDSINNSPPLIIEDVPREAESLALIVDDPDATMGGTFTHWVVWNIPPDTFEIPEGEAPKGAVQGRNDFGNEGYGGPCPPKGSKPHRYIFKLYALDKTLDLKRGSAKDSLEKAMENHILAQATLIGLYARTV